MSARIARWFVGLAFVAATPLALAADDADAARLAIRTKQFSEAVKLLTTQAGAGSTDAEYLLGLALWNGIGVPSDRSAAREQLKRAAEGGHGPAAFALAALLADGTTADRAEAGSWLARAAKAGYLPATTLQSAHALPGADARIGPGFAPDLKLEFARGATRRDDDALLAVVITRDLTERRGEFGRTLLFDAVDAGAARSARIILAAGAAVNAVDEYGETPLMLAAKRADTPMTKLLLGAGAQANLADKAGRTALFRAAAADRAEQITTLLAAGAQVDHADSQGATALDVAANSDATAALEALRAAGGHSGTGAVVASRSTGGLDPTRTGVLYQGWQPLSIAAARDDAAEVGRRLAAGAEVDAKNPLGMTALDVALASHSLRAARALIDAGANLARKAADGSDVLEEVARAGDPALLAAALARAGGVESRGARLVAFAVQRGDASMTQALLAAGAPPGGDDPRRMTPLMTAARAGDIALVKLLVERGARVDARDAHGRTALWYAAAAGSGVVAAALLAANAPVDTADRDGATPLVAAIRAGSPSVVERLLAAGAAIDGPGTAKLQPLRTAVEQRQAALLPPLLARKPTIDAVDEFGDTALMLAARNGDQEISVQLVAAGANLRLRNRDHATAADLAESRGFKALAQKLKG